MACMMEVQYLHNLMQNAKHLGDSSTSQGKLVEGGWCIGGVSGSHDQLVISANKVIWYEGLDPSIQTVRKVYSTETIILQAFWCNFSLEEENKRRGSGGGAKGCGGVCIREQECLGIYMESGAVHYVPLPFQVKEVWPLADGLLVERQIGGDSAYDGLPTLFSLLHPMDDLCPVTYRRPTATSSSVSVLGFFGEPGVGVLNVCTRDTPTQLVMTYNSSTGQHSIGVLRPATSEDIPSHLTTPQRPHSAMTTPNDKPLSISDPVCYGNEATPSGLMNTPVEMILNTCRPSATTEKPKLPLLSRLQQQVIESSGGCDPQAAGSGRSPFVCRLQTPAKEAFLKKCSKSLSPTSMSHMSPFSQTVDSRSWSTFYSDEISFGNKFEPLFPQLCLHNLWTSTAESSANSTASSIFYTCDLVGRGHVGVVIPALKQVWLIGCTEEDKSLQLVAMESIPGVQAVSMTSLSIVLVLDSMGELDVYSGPVKMGRIALHESPVPLRESALMRVADVIDSTFTLMFQSGTAVRCCVSPSPHHPMVQLCLSAMIQLLPEGLARTALCQYHTNTWTLPPSQHLPHFTHWLTMALGMGDPPSASSDRSGADLKMLHQLPALKLLVGGVTGGGSSAEEEAGVAMDTSSDAQDVGACFLVRYRKTLALGLHVVYEELKLHPKEFSSLSELAMLLLRVTSCLGWQQYVDHYQRDFPSLFHEHQLPTELNEEDTPISPPTSPPHIQQWLLCKLQNSQPPPFPVIPEVSKRTIQLIKLYSLLICGSSREALSSLMTPLTDSPPPELSELSWASQERLQCPPEQRVVLCLVDEGLTFSDLESLPVGVALPLLDCVQRCHEAPPSCWSVAAYNMIGRHDISMTLDSTATLTTPTLEFKGDSDGMNLDLEVLKLRFPQDLRAKEVRRLLQSAEPVRISITQKPEVSDHEFIQQQETHLLALCQRTLALPVGRGMFTLSTVRALPTSPLSIPPLNLCGRAPPRNANISLEHVDKPLDMAKWAEFHNGVASGLRLASSSSKLDAAWIMFNRPSEQESSNMYAGFLMGLGLTGHLVALHEYDLYAYLQDKHELTVVGVLLGVAASNCGKATPSLVSLLSVYIPPLLPRGSADMEISHSMQTAALLGIGLLHMASADRHMAEVMLEEIGHTPGPELEFAEDRESYSLSAGLALGMIMLGLGAASSPQLMGNLLLLMNGGHKQEGMGRAPSAPSHLVMEGEFVNTHVTAPGAIVALGLMYLKTNDRTVAAKLDVPKTLYELECIRPDFLLLRAVSHGLVMWDSIQPTQHWIDQHIPSVVHEALARTPSAEEQERQSHTSDLETLYQTRAYVTAGCCLAIGFRYAGTCQQKPYKCLLAMVRQFVDMTRVEGLVGKHCVEQCLMTVLLGVAMVMSGSGDLQVLRLIRQLRVRVERSEVTYGSHLATHMALGLLFLGSGRYTLTNSNVGVASLLCALFPCFPLTSLDNRYHLQALRHLYVLAARPGVLVTRDVETGEARCVQLQVRVQGGEVREMVTPCLIRDWDKLEEVTLTSADFLPATIKFGAERGDAIRKSLSQSGLLYVQEKAMKKEIRVGGGPLPVGGGRRCGLGSVRGKVSLPHVKGSAVFQSGLPTLLSRQSCASSKFLAAALLDCLQQEKLLAFSSYLQMEQCINQVIEAASDHTHTQCLWQLKLASAYTRLSSLEATPIPGSPLLSEEYVRMLGLRVWHFLWQREEDILSALRTYMKVESMCEGAWSHSVAVLVMLVTLLVWYDIPSPNLLHITPQSKLPDVFLKLRELGSGASAAIRLQPLLEQLPNLPPYT